MAVRFPARSELRCQDTDWPNIPELIAGSSYFTSFQTIQGCVFAHCQDVHDNSITCPCCKGNIHAECVKTSTQDSSRFVDGVVGCPVCSWRAAKVVLPPAPAEEENPEPSLEQQLESFPANHRPLIARLIASNDALVRAQQDLLTQQTQHVQQAMQNTLPICGLPVGFDAQVPNTWLENIGHPYRLEAVKRELRDFFGYQSLPRCPTANFPARKHEMRALLTAVEHLLPILQYEEARTRCLVTLHTLMARLCSINYTDNEGLDGVIGLFEEKYLAYSPLPPPQTNALTSHGVQSIQNVARETAKKAKRDKETSKYSSANGGHRFSPYPPKQQTQYSYFSNSNSSQKGGKGKKGGKAANDQGKKDSSDQ